MPVCTSRPIDLGGGIAEAEVRFLDDVPEGLYYEHPCVDGRPSPGWVPFTGEYKWDLVSLQPLTLSPSLLCRTCGHHGFVRNGKWESV